MRKINKLVAHCTATPPNSWTIEDLEDYFYNKKGWNHPGYHTVFREDGRHYELLSFDQIANGAIGHNSDSVHVCYLGGVDSDGNAKDTRTAAQKANMAMYIKNLSIAFPQARILGHRDLSPDVDGSGEVEPDEFIKECPSFEVSEWLKNIGL